MVMERKTGGELYRHTTALLLCEQPRQQPLTGVKELLILLSIEICVSHKFTAGFLSYEFQSGLLLSLIQSSSVSQLVFHNLGSSTSPKSHSGLYRQVKLLATGLIVLQDIPQWKRMEASQFAYEFSLWWEYWLERFILWRPKAFLLCNLHTLARILKSWPKCSNSLHTLTSI